MAFPVAEERIAAAERELGVRLPAKHRARLARDNGGEVLCEGSAWCVHPVWDDTDRRTAARTASHIVHETREARGAEGERAGNWRGRGEARRANGAMRGREDLGTT